MYCYHVMQWLLFFYIYCFFGWIWESCYVSVRQKKWVNRGFMHGPFLPIYGSGAVIILLATLPVKDHLFLIFIFGMIAASILEYFTGAAMERLFHVRYWDYSNEFLNVNGHICLKCSLCWGAFSILMVKVIHIPIEDVVLKIPMNIQEIVTLILTVIVVSDFTVSFNEAMDLRRVLDNIVENSEELQRIQKRVEVIATFAEADMDELRNQMEEKLSIVWENALDRKEQFLENHEEHKDLLKENTQYILNSSYERMKLMMEALKDKIRDKRGLEAVESESYKELDSYQNRLQFMKETVENYMKNRHFQKKVKSMLARNPIAAAKFKNNRYEQAWKQLKKQLQERKQENE